MAVPVAAPANGPDIHRHTGILRVVVSGLVAVAILAVIATSVLAYNRRPIPEALIGIGSAAVGALSTLLARVSPPD